ncbi:MAG: FAD-dependent monooxygenase, partial [Terriglobia bacterium]
MAPAVDRKPAGVYEQAHCLFHENLRVSRMISDMLNDSVLIIGGGPTGLIVTHELLRRGIACRLIDKRETPAGSTRAFTVHARTMEMFDHMGIA